MSIHTVTRCDQCGEEVSYASIEAAVGTQQGVNGTETAYDLVDLCPIHLRMALAELVQTMGVSEAAAWVERWRTKPVPKRL